MEVAVVLAWAAFPSACGDGASESRATGGKNGGVGAGVGRAEGGTTGSMSIDRSCSIASCWSVPGSTPDATLIGVAASEGHCEVSSIASSGRLGTGPGVLVYSATPSPACRGGDPGVVGRGRDGACPGTELVIAVSTSASVGLAGGGRQENWVATGIGYGVCTITCRGTGNMQSCIVS